VASTLGNGRSGKASWGNGLGERPRGGKERATPGGYGGKPPGVAFIGAPTGARNAGNGAPAGDQSTGKHVTPNRPQVRQDRIRSESQDHG